MQLKSELAILEMMKRGSSMEHHKVKNQYRHDKNNELLAEKNPLDFIDAVLTNHPQP